MTAQLIRCETMHDTNGEAYAYVRTYATSSPHIEIAYVSHTKKGAPFQAILYVGAQDFEAQATPEVMAALAKVDEMNAADFLSAFFCGASIGAVQ